MRLPTLIISLGLIFSCQVVAEQKMIYESVVKGDIVKVLWGSEEKENKTHIKIVKKEKNVTMECLPDFSLLNYSEKTGGSRELNISKVGPCLIVKNYEKGKEKILSHKIDKMPWIQEFTFGFQPFIKSNKNSYEFCIVYPKDLALHEMIATKEEEEEIEIGGKKYSTQKVKITLAGFKKSFWKGYAWFDKQSALMVRYKANEGPRTPYMETSLVEVIQ